MYCTIHTRIYKGESYYICTYSNHYIASYIYINIHMRFTHSRAVYVHYIHLRCRSVETGPILSFDLIFWFIIQVLFFVILGYEGVQTSSSYERYSYMYIYPHLPYVFHT